MTLTSAPTTYKRAPACGRIGRVLPASLCLLLLTAAPALAEPVKVGQVVQTLTSSQGVLDLRLNSIAQDPATKGSQQNGPRGESVAKTQGPGGAKTESIISSVIVTAEGKTIGVDDIEDGEVDGTICDCGEILIAGDAFPKWPFLFLAAVPVVFINTCDDCENPSSSPTPIPPSNSTSTPTPTPEPASLLMLGTGLLAAGAGLRRRYTRSKTLDQMKEDE